MKLDQLEFLVKIAQTNSITEAAKQLHVSQPNISTSLKELEDELNCRLFKRTKKGMIPTDEGVKASQIAGEILDLVEQLKLVSGQISSGTEGQISLCTVPCLNLRVLPRTFLKFEEQLPKVKVKNHVNSTEESIENTLTGKCDLAIVAMFPEEFSRYSERLSTSYLAPLPLVIGTSRNVAEKLGSGADGTIELEKLKDYRIYTSSEENTSINNVLRDALIQAGNSASQFHFSSNSADGLIDMIMHNGGIMISPEMVFIDHPSVMSNDIQVFKIADAIQIPQLTVIWPKGRRLSVIQRTLLSALNDTLSSYTNN